MPKQATRNLIRGAQSIAGLGLVAAATWIAFAGVHANALIAGFAYVLIVLIVAARWGLIESLLTSVGAMLCLNYFFLPPIGSFTIADPQNWVALFAFMVTAVTASQLSASARNRAAEAHGATRGGGTTLPGKFVTAPDGSDREPRHADSRKT